MLRGLVKNEALTSEQEQHIDQLQSEIDEIWNRRGNYQIDPDAWEDMPFFMEHISEEDIAKNESCAALASIVYDEVPPDEIAENRKTHGNHALNLALNPNQERRENLARAACSSYTEALQAKGKDKNLTSTIYANRSLAQYIIGNYGHALEDAQRSIVLNPSYRKAYYRAAKSALALKKYDIALQLLDKGRQISDPPMDAAATAEFAELETLCTQWKERKNAEDAKLNRTVRVQAAKVSNIARAITSAGIKISSRAEVTSEQMGVYSNPQPFFDSDGLLHVPLLFMYDEYQQTDIMHDVACDVCAAELLEELIPFPWDDRGRYQKISDIIIFYKIDDGAKEPEYYEVHQGWPLLEVFRSEKYQMPQLMPVLHVICQSSDLVECLKIHRVK
ncbi:hypothetical protein ABL78_6978 [Leptomonas seymouri]|uniref:Uncharacterized protein n=1 Tax=Leptomonas seymouri TaxID=5684 RepID=A0A0N0P3R4_LEPSE|nr:hypothetical protein ABL78_6978 [Leptomonas seymouri]|eukprot:KPI83967.1 hypothetical protein ABL78_6978 [Leptomonas seymouri]